MRRRPTRRFAKTSFDPMVCLACPHGRRRAGVRLVRTADARSAMAPPRGRAVGASSAYNKVARGPSARHRRWVAQRSEPETTAMLNSLDVEGLSRDTRVVVAMSGGVDSSVTAGLAKSQRY